MPVAFRLNNEEQRLLQVDAQTGEGFVAEAKGVKVKELQASADTWNVQRKPRPAPGFVEEGVKEHRDTGTRKQATGKGGKRLKFFNGHFQGLIFLDFSRRRHILQMHEPSGGDSIFLIGYAARE